MCLVLLRLQLFVKVSHPSEGSFHEQQDDIGVGKHLDENVDENGRVALQTGVLEEDPRHDAVLEEDTGHDPEQHAEGEMSTPFATPGSEDTQENETRARQG